MEFPLKNVMLFSFIFIFLISFAVADCTLTLDETNYVEGEIVDVDGICDSGSEKNQAYTINWTNATGFVLESDTGTTPSTINTLFSETFIIPSGYVATYGNTLNATMTGTTLEGTDSSTISTSSISDLIISNIVISSSFLIGKFGALDFIVKDNNGDAISNAQCIIDIVDENDLPLSPAGGKTIVPSQGDGKVLYSLFFDETFVEEGKSYKWDIACACLNATDITTSTIGICNNGNDGNRVLNFKDGESQFPFTMNSWISVNTVVDKTEYTPKQTIFICSNVTNTRTTRTPLHIFHQVRCSAGVDNDDDVDRILIITDGLNYDERGIDANKTQMQCKEFVIPEIRHFEGVTSECTATTTTWVVNERDEKISGYETASSIFNITSDELNMPVDWEKIANYTFNTIINLSDSRYADWNGTGIGSIDIVISSQRGEILDPRKTTSIPRVSLETLFLSNQIKSITSTNLTGGTVTNVLEYLEDGKLEIELRNVDISQNGFYNVTIVFEEFEKRSTTALEGIENKTGTFAFSINADEDSREGLITFSLSALLEISEQESVEGFFSCYVKNYKAETEIQFENAINKTSAFTTTRTLNVPNQLVGIQTVQCDLGFIGFGNDKDTATDTFLIGSIGGSFKIIDDKKNIIKNIVNKISPFSEPINKKLEIFLYILLIVAFISLIVYGVRKRK